MYLDGIDNVDWAGTYGVSSTGKEVSIQFVTNGPYSTNIGSRMYLLDPSENEYYMFKLKNKELTMDVDVSMLPCGLNGAVYLVEMDKDGGASKHPTNKGIEMSINFVKKATFFKTNNFFCARKLTNHGRTSNSFDHLEKISF